MAPVAINTFGWRRDERLPPDESFLDLVLAVTRNSQCAGGHMGAAIVSPSTHEVIVVGVNSPLFYGEGSSSRKSDVHAEANCISSCSKVGRKTEGCSIYITMPPCKTCFGLIVAAGIKRIVFRKVCISPEMVETAARVGVEMVSIGQEMDARCLERVKELWREGRDRDVNEDESERKRYKTS